MLKLLWLIPLLPFAGAAANERVILGSMRVVALVGEPYRRLRRTGIQPRRGATGTAKQRPLTRSDPESAILQAGMQQRALDTSAYRAGRHALQTVGRPVASWCFARVSQV